MNNPPDLHDLTKEQKDVLLGLYCESCTHARHYEAQRATVSNIIILGTVGMIGYIHHLDHEDWPLTLAIMFLGIFGSAFTTIYFWRISRFERRAEEFLSALNVLLFKMKDLDEESPLNLAAILERADGGAESDTSEFHKLRRLPRIAWFRMLWPLFIAIFALVVTVWAYFYCAPAHNQSQFTITYTEKQ